MLNYILHIGLPKTGTKYLQTHFRRHEPFLTAAGVHYPSDWWISKYDINHDGLVKDIIARNERVVPFFSNLKKSNERTVLLSCEGLSDLSEADLMYLRSLIGEASVQIVFFCRRWSDWIPSAWQQTVKQGSSQTFPEFLVQVVSDARLIPTINFRIVLDKFAKAFGRSTIAIVPYSNLLDENLNIVEVFYRHFLGIEQVPDVTRESIHSSLGLQMAETVRALNSLSIRSHGKSNVSTFRRVEEFQDETSIGEPLKRIATAMDDCIGQIAVGDFNEPFVSLFQELTRDFTDLVRDVGAGTKLFEPHSASRQFVRPDYMLVPGVAEDIVLLHDRLASIGAAEDAAHVDATKYTLKSNPSWQFDMQVMQGEAAVDYLTEYPLAVTPSDRGRNVLLYDLKEGSVPDGMLVEGWSVPEAQGTWTDGECAVLKLPRSVSRESYRLRLVLRPFLAPPKLPAQGFNLIVNGQVVGRAQISQFAVVEVSVPWDVLGHLPYVTIALETQDCAKPRDLIGIRDERRLALNVEQISMRCPQAETETATLFQDASSAEAVAGEAAETEESRLSNLMLRFESLGENCEFGLVQRRCGAEPLGLFRFSSTPFTRLLTGLQSKFKGMGKSNSIQIEVSRNGKEYMVLDKKYGFLFHAWVLVGERSPEEVKLREMRRIPFLVRKLTEDLMLGEKIFVYHGMQPLNLEQARQLLAALREYGPGTLLWVELADEPHQPGTVIEIQPGLLKGYVDRFAPGENAHDLSLECWIELCCNASRLTRALYRAV
jgi:hypothetical protein